MTAKVALVVVSHSPDVARGAVDMARQMAGPDVAMSWCGGNAAGGLGTNVGDISRCIEQVWNETGVVVLVDLGGAEMNAELAIEALPSGRREKVILCDAPIVEGLVMAATKASLGASLAAVRAAAEQMRL